MNQQKIILFMPSIEKGGAEKNLFIISNYLCKKFKKLTVISASKKVKKNFNKKVQFLCPKSEIWNDFGRGLKNFISIFFLIKKILQDRKTLVLSFQANIYAIIICKIFSVNIVTRSNSFPDDWTNNFIKKFIFKKILSLANENIVNSVAIRNKFRLNYKINTKNKKTTFRLGLGNGYRVANIFTEDHAALTGARDVIFSEQLNPETSWNGNLNFEHRWYGDKINKIGIDASLFYTYFNNKIIPDYITDVNKIIYSNLNGYAISKGATLNFDFILNKQINARIGATFIDLYSVENEEKIYPYLTEKFSGVWSFQYKFKSIDLQIDYTGNIYSPMKLPLLGELDPRSAYSPWYSIQNIKVTHTLKKGIQMYLGVKNLLNWTPNQNTAFIIARSNDPFDNNVQYDTNGNVMATANNPYALTFDPSYVYAPNQGIRFFVGIKYSF